MGPSAAWFYEGQLNLLRNWKLETPPKSTSISSAFSAVSLRTQETTHSLTWTPGNVYYMMLSVNNNLTLLQREHYIITFTTFLYICANFFVFPVKFDPVRRVVVKMIPRKKSQPTAAAACHFDANGTHPVARVALQ